LKATLQWLRKEEKKKPRGLHRTIEAKAEGVADPGTHDGFKGSAAHLAGEPFLQGLNQVEMLEQAFRNQLGSD